MLQAPSLHWQATLAYLPQSWIQISLLTTIQTPYLSHAFNHICALCQIHGALDNSTAATVASTLLSAHLKFSTMLTRYVVVPNWPPGSSSLHLLKQLHWLPVEWHTKLPHSH